MKKFISSIIALAMVVAMLPMTMASAAGGTTLNSWELTDEYLNVALNGTFMVPNDNGSALKSGAGALSGYKASQTNAGHYVDWVQFGKGYAELDLGKVETIEGIYLSRGKVNDNYQMAEIKFWGSETKLTAAPTEATATLLGTFTAEQTAEAFAIQAADKTHQYIYLTGDQNAQRIYEFAVYAPMPYNLANVSAGLKAVDNYGNTIDWLTDGDYYEYYNKYGPTVNDNNGLATDGSEWYKLDLQDVYDIKYYQNSHALGGDYQQANLVVKASATDDFENADIVVNKGYLSREMKRKVEGKYRYFWFYAPDNSTGGGTVYLDDIRIYALDDTARTTTVEFENYADEIAAAYGVEAIASSSYIVTGDEGAAGNVYLHTQSNHRGGGKATYIRGMADANTIEIPLTIKGDAWYAVEAQMGNSTALQGAIGVVMTLVDAQGNETFLVENEYQEDGLADYTTMKRVNPASAAYTWLFSGQTNYIKGGNYTLKLQVAKGSIFLDYLKFTPVEPKAISTTEATTIELEDYDVQYSNDKLVGTSGGKALYTTWGTPRQTTYPNKYNIPVTVEAAGNYNISAVLSNISAYSRQTVYVDGVKLFSNSTSGQATEITGATMQRYSGSTELTAGEHVITLEVAITGDNHTKFGADCITIGIDNRAPMTVEFTNLADGAQNVTNIANLAEHVYGDGSYDNLTTIVEPIWVQFSDNVDMQTVSASTVKVNKGTTAVSYTPVIDAENKRLGVDIADLDPNTTYTIEVTDGVKSTEGKSADTATLTFETHVPAKIRYKEGTTIKNIAYGANTKIVGDNSKSPTPAITDVYRWTNGVMGAEAIDSMALNTAGDPAPYAIIDLGDTYQIMGQATVSGSSNWQSRYFQMNVLQSEDEALSDSNLLEKVGNTYSTGYCQSTLENARGRYIAIKSLGQDAQDDGKGHLKLSEVLILTQEVPNAIAQYRKTRIEAEDYADEFAAAFGETAYEDGLGSYANPTQPVGKVKFTDADKSFSGNYAMMGSKATEGEKTFSIPVNVTEEGYYNATFRVGGTMSNMGFAWFDAALVAEDGTEYVLSDGIIRPVMETGSGENIKNDKEAVETQVRINDGQARYSWQLTGTSVNVPAGKYNLKFTIDGTTFLLDYVDISPVAAAAVGDKIEVDDVNIRRVAYDESLASGGTIQYAHWAYEDDEQIKLVYPIKIDEAGYYDVETVMFYSEGNNTSRTKVMIGDKVVYDNRNTATDLSTVNEEGNRIFVNGHFPMNKYTGGKVYLEPGVHEIVYVINATQEPAQYVYKFAYDYTKVTKSQDSIDVADDGYVTITANYTEPVTGTVYMAFYNDGALVSVEKSTNANNQTVVNGEAQGPTTDYDYVKMFVWDVENDNIAPDAFAIGFAQ